MSGHFKSFPIPVILILCLGVFQACSTEGDKEKDPMKEQEKSTEESQSDQETSDTKESATNNCGSKSIPTPTSIESFIESINGLPSDASVACVISALPRPLRLAATSHENSAQGATGPKSPRIFIDLSPILLSIVPSGRGSNIIEMSEVYNAENLLTIKGEIELPRAGNFKESDPFSRVWVANEAACGNLCHGVYKQTKTFDDGTIQYASSQLFIKPSMAIPFSDLETWAEECASFSEERCTIYRALFDQGQVEGFDYAREISK